MICVFHEWKVKGLYYKPVASMGWNYGIQLIEEYQCKKCGKKKSIIVEKYNNDSYMAYVRKLEEIERRGIKSFYNE